MKLSDIPDKLLADMVRSGCYAAGTEFTETGSKYLLVLAVPYGPVDIVDSLPTAFGAFRDLLADNDWRERNIQVLTIKDGAPVVEETSYETLEANPPCSECGEPTDDGEGYDGLCGNCADAAEETGYKPFADETEVSHE